MGKRWKQLQSDIQYGDFYQSWKQEIIRMLQQYKQEGKRVVTWGAGLKGSSFLHCMDPEHKYIEYVIDMKENLHDTQMPTGHLITGRDIITKKNIDVVLVMNDVYYVDIFLTLQKHGYSGKVIDIDKMIKEKKSVEEMQNLTENSWDSEDLFGYTMRDIQRKVIEILHEVDRICKRYDITYFLEAGSALGAIRYGQMIPCDDDIDIAMLREDYDRFLEVASRELQKEYILQTLDKNSDYPYLYAQVMADKTCFVRERQKMLRMHHGIHIDIAPLDTVPADEESRRKQKAQVEKYKALIRKKKIPEAYQSTNPGKQLIVNWDYYCLKLVPLSWLEKKALKAFWQYRGQDTGWVGDLCTHYKKDISFQIEEILPVKQHRFEDGDYPLPGNPDYYLRAMYDDYKVLSPRETGSTKYELAAVSLEENYEVER